MTRSYDAWLGDVRSALQSINMPMDEWQKTWHFDFEREYKAGSEASKTAEKANRCWWYQQNKAMHQECRRTSQCWLPWRMGAYMDPSRLQEPPDFRRGGRETRAYIRPPTLRSD